MRLSLIYYICFISISILIIRCNGSSSNEIEKKVVSKNWRDTKLESINPISKQIEKPIDNPKKIITALISKSLEEKIMDIFFSRIDTLMKNKFTMSKFQIKTKYLHKPYSLLAPSANCKIMEYYFTYANGNSSIKYLSRFSVKIASYSDTTELNQVFESLKNECCESDIGLTYSNDYLIKTSNQIYWLNSGCPYEYPLHRTIGQLLVDTYQIKNIQDSILVKCGGKCPRK